MSKAKFLKKSELQKPLPTPPGPRLVQHKDPFMSFVFDAGLAACVALLIYGAYRIFAQA